MLIYVGIRSSQLAETKLRYTVSEYRSCSSAIDNCRIDGANHIVAYYQVSGLRSLVLAGIFAAARICVAVDVANECINEVI